MPSISCMYLNQFWGPNELTTVRFQAATAHSFHLPPNLALQSVTSVPAKSLELDHRIGYVRAGYDADIVVWDSHPLSVGATPQQVYIDGRPTLDETKVIESSQKSESDKRPQFEPKMRTRLATHVKEDFCQKVEQINTVITGITKSYLKSTNGKSLTSENLTMVLKSGKVLCFGSTAECRTTSIGAHTLSLENGHVLPGLTAVSTSLGLVEISGEDRTGDGSVSAELNPLDPENVVHAKYGVHLEGRAFDRARIAGVTRAISAPMGTGFLRGISVGIKTHGNTTILDGGIFKDDVALHFVVGQESKSEPNSCLPLWL